MHLKQKLEERERSGCNVWENGRQKGIFPINQDNNDVDDEWCGKIIRKPLGWTKTIYGTFKKQHMSSLSLSF